MYCDHKVDLIPDSAAIAEPQEGVCPVDWAKALVDIARKENCGKSVMCRDGMTQLQAIISDVVTGRGQGEDIELLRDLCTTIAGTIGCELSIKAAKGILLTLDRYGDEWDAHCRRKRCTALVCPSYYSMYIDPAACTGCGACKKAAPEGAVDGAEGLIHVVKDDGLLKTDAFIAVCPADAIKKAGAVKPRLPEEPVPVGSFSAEGGRRRRRGASRGEE